MSSTLLMTGPTQTVGSIDSCTSAMQNSEISLESDSWGVAGRIPEFKDTCSMAQLHYWLWMVSWHCLSMHWTSLNNVELLASRGISLTCIWESFWQKNGFLQEIRASMTRRHRPLLLPRHPVHRRQRPSCMLMWGSKVFEIVTLRYTAMYTLSL